MERNYRLRANVGSDAVLNVNMRQDFDFLEVLSLRLRQKDTYKLHSSSYGVIVGRVLANDAFGIPNAKVSVFIEKDDADTTEISQIYPYEEITSKDSEGRRYNLLQDYSDDACYKVVGTFPNKRYVLDDDSMLEVYDKYWKYTTVTNQAGDYMLFAVPTGSQQIHVDIDLSDIGVLSQKPRDFEYKGYNISMFDSPVQFKDSTNLDNLAQLFSQNKSVNVYPFWGDDDNGIAAITRCDVQIQYKFEPTCVFMGSIISDNDANSIGHKCAPSVNNGMNNQLIGGNGTIEMIRKTTDGLVEEYQIQGNQLIDENGVWCYQIPMNLDYIGTDEYGNVVPTDNPSKGIPTRAQVRFRISKTESGDEGFSRHTAKYLVPMNPILNEKEVVPTLKVSGSEAEKMYNFGSATPDSCFRDLYWNNVYSVKNYIPKSQVAHRPYANNYTALKGANLVDNQNPVPFNKLRVDMPFSYVIVCVLFTIVMYIIMFINQLVCIIDETVLRIYNAIRNFCLPKIPLVGRICPFKPILPKLGYLGCLSLAGGFGEDNTTFYPGCWCRGTGLKAASCGGDQNGNCNKSTDTARLMDSVQRSLALDHKIAKLDFYQDWINGTLYMPLWYWRKRKKKTFLFGLFSSKAKSQYCSCDSRYTRLKTSVTCNIEYSKNDLTTNNSLMPNNEDRWHKRRSGSVSYKRGLIKPVENKDGLTVYYYVGMQPTTNNPNSDLQLGDMGKDVKIALLYATDIILLGNLEPNNIYGIPQFYNCLPSTSANIPPIASVEENITDEDDNDSDSPTSVGEDSGLTVTTGMDWGHDYNDQTPKYQRGLFMDLSCTYANTKPKSCINVERLSEFGVNLDMSYDMEYHSGNSIKSGKIEADGFVSKYELDDTENRAMFATLNHIGFVPQPYQDSIKSYTTQVEDANTNYLVNKFKYIYPTDFDGRLQVPMDLYKKGFEQVEMDKKDDSYLTFRFGAEGGTSDSNSEGRIRHFYHTDGGKFSMPLYNNSYYFYFGVKKGSTAIDKFNKMFNASCFKRQTHPFTIDITKRGRSYCPSMYGNDRDGYGYIKIVMDDITVPYSYTLTDSLGNEVVSETGMSLTSFAIGGIIDEDGNVIVKDQGAVKKQIDGSKVTNEYKNGLTNQDYTLEVTDANGKTMTERIVLSVPSISTEYTTTNLGTKFYSTTSTTISYICNKQSMFYGVISIKGFTVDGYEFLLDNASNLTTPSDNDDYYSYSLVGKRKDGNSTYTANAVIRVSAVNRDDISSTEDCMCKVIGNTVNYFEFTSDKVLKLYVYMPNRFSLTITQMCGNKATTNTSNDIVTISNGSNFKAYLNDMPVKFLLGSSSEASPNSKFYSSSVVTNATDSRISGWYGVNDENSYIFGDNTENSTTSNNEESWGDYVTLGESITSVDSKRNILKYKFDTMFSLSEATFVTSNSSCKFRYDADGGTAPTLFRSLYPNYDDSSKVANTYTLDDYGVAECTSAIPNIVGDNYNGVQNSPSFNGILSSNTNKQGNYFAAFTSDGGYKTKNTIDGKVSVMRIPNHASVSPLSDNSVKTKGKDLEGEIEKFKYAYSSGYQALPNDSRRHVKPYLRAMFLDRRFDYDLVVLAPFIGSSFSLGDDNKVTWKSSRLSGFTYGGIEMAYDDEYNIISANTTDSSASAINSVYEYTYSYNGNSDENVHTMLNKARDINNGNVFKRFYESTINDLDVTKMYWSTFNKDRLVANSSSFNDDTSIPRVFQYPKDNESLYNGEFAKDNFTTKRFIDIGNIPRSTDFSYGVTCCGYDLDTELNSDGEILAKAVDGETTSIDLTFESPITFINPSSDNKDYGNVVYSHVKGSSKDGYRIFKASECSLMFKYNTKDSSDYDVYTKTPKAIKVLWDGMRDVIGDKQDGITYYKTIEKKQDSDITLDDAIEKIKFKDGEFNKSTVSFWDKLKGESISVILPEGTELGDGYKSKYDKREINGTFFKDSESHEFLMSNDTRFGEIIFSKTFKLDRDRAKVFSILVDREYRYQANDNLTRHLRTIETSDLYDCRDLLIKPLNKVKNKDDSGETLYSYTTLSDFGQTDVTVSGSSAGSTTASTKVLTQVISFEFRFSTSGKAINLECQAFADTSMMTYTFKFSNRSDSYYLTPSNTTVTQSDDGKYCYIRITVNWTQDMGTLFDSKWNTCKCIVLAKTNSNFSYKMNEFSISHVGDKKATEVGKDEVTNVTMDN